MELSLLLDDNGVAIPLRQDATGGHTATFSRDGISYVVHVDITATTPRRCTPAKARFA